MKALILAAGVGARLFGCDDKASPKSLLLPSSPIFFRMWRISRRKNLYATGVRRGLRLIKFLSY